MQYLVGGDTTIKNNAKRTPYELAKDPECGRLLRGAIGMVTWTASTTVKFRFGKGNHVFG